MTTLSEFVCVMNVRNQSCQSSVTCLSPLCDLASLFFCAVIRSGSQSVKETNGCTRAKNLPHSPKVSSSVLHFEGHAINPNRSSAIKQRRGESSCGGATQQRTPSARQGRSGAASEQIGHSLSLHPRQVGDELGCFCGETPFNLTRQHDKPPLCHLARPTLGTSLLCFGERAATRTR